MSTEIRKKGLDILNDQAGPHENCQCVQPFVPSVMRTKVTKKVVINIFVRKEAI